MKDKIMNFPLIRFIINLRICQWAANNPVLSRFCNYEVILATLSVVSLQPSSAM